MLVDDFLPVYDVSVALATVVDADLETTWGALLDVDLVEVGRRRPMIGALSVLRALPEIVSHLVHGELPDAPPKSLTLRDTTEQPAESGGWVLLGERPNDEIALGMVGKLWRPVIQFASVDADAFSSFAEPGYAKTIYALSVRELDDRHTMLRAEMRTATTDERARTWFRRYWTFGVGSGAQVLVQGVLDLTREIAEARS